MRVRPEVVVEVAYNEIQKSPSYPSGFALRFARITRVRDDKAPAQATSLDELRLLYERQFAVKGRAARLERACMAFALERGTLWRLLALTALLLASADRAIGSPGRPARISPAEQDFIREHWRRPIPPQGPAPAAFSPLERSLAPASCGTCHPDQFRDWQTSLHARSMGPGISGPARRDDQE